MNGSSDIKNPYARPGRPLYNYDRHVDNQAKKIVTLNRNLVEASSLSAPAKIKLQGKIDRLERALRHGNDSRAVKVGAFCLGAAMVLRARGARDQDSVYTQGLAKSGHALRTVFSEVGTCYNFHETVGPEQDAYFASLREAFIALDLTPLTRSRPNIASPVPSQSLIGTRASSLSLGVDVAAQIGAYLTGCFPSKRRADNEFPMSNTQKRQVFSCLTPRVYVSPAEEVISRELHLTHV